MNINNFDEVQALDLPNLYIIHPLCLYVAAQLGNLDMVKLLLYVVKCNSLGYTECKTALNAAIKANHYTIESLLYTALILIMHFRRI